MRVSNYIIDTHRDRPFDGWVQSHFLKAASGRHAFDLLQQRQEEARQHVPYPEAHPVLPGRAGVTLDDLRSSDPTPRVVVRHGEG